MVSTNKETWLKVLNAASEYAHILPSGGMGDVNNALNRHLNQKEGLEVHTVLPYCEGVIKDEYKKRIRYERSYIVDFKGKKHEAKLYRYVSEDPGETSLRFIGNDEYLGADRTELYTDGKNDAHLKFGFFNHALFSYMFEAKFFPHIIHVHDWQMGLLPVLVKANPHLAPLARAKVFFEIHNLAYKGLFGREDLTHMGLNDGYFTPDKLEFHGQASMLKAGIVYADAIITVSNRYAAEITAQFGEGLEGLLKAREKSLFGILNGIEYDFYPSMKAYRRGITHE